MTREAQPHKEIFSEAAEVRRLQAKIAGTEAEASLEEASGSGFDAAGRHAEVKHLREKLKAHLEE